MRIKDKIVMRAADCSHYIITEKERIESGYLCEIAEKNGLDGSMYVYDIENQACESDLLDALKRKFNGDFEIVIDKHRGIIVKEAAAYDEETEVDEAATAFARRWLDLNTYKVYGTVYADKNFRALHIVECNADYIEYDYELLDETDTASGELGRLEIAINNQCDTDLLVVNLPYDDFRVNCSKQYQKQLLKHQIATAVRDCRLLADKSQQQAADESGIGRSTIAQIEAGLFNPSYDVLVRLCRALDARVRIEHI